MGDSECSDMSVDHSTPDSSNADSGLYGSDWSYGAAPVPPFNHALRSASHQIVEAQQNMDTEMLHTDQMLSNQWDPERCPSTAAIRGYGDIDIIELMTRGSEQADTQPAVPASLPSTLGYPSYPSTPLTPSVSNYALHHPEHTQYLPSTLSHPYLPLIDQNHAIQSHPRHPVYAQHPPLDPRLHAPPSTVHAPMGQIYHPHLGYAQHGPLIPPHLCPPSQTPHAFIGQTYAPYGLSSPPVYPQSGTQFSSDLQATYHAQPRLPDRPPALATPSPAANVFISETFADHRVETSTENSGESSDQSSLKYYLDNGYCNWHKVLKKSHRHAHDGLIENLLVEPTDQWAMEMINLGIRDHCTTPSHSLEPGCAVTPLMLQCVKRYFRRTLKGDRKKVNTIAMRLLKLSTCSAAEVKRRVLVWLQEPYQKYLHVRGSTGAIQIPFGLPLVQQCVTAIGYGSKVPVGMGWSKLLGAPVKAFAYVGNLILSCLMDHSTGVYVEVRLDNDRFGPAFGRTYRDAKSAETNEPLAAIRKQLCQEGIQSINPTPLPINLQGVYKHRLDSTPEAHRYMLAVARSQCITGRRRSL